MLATKTGIRKNGLEAHNYKSLVWLGRAANIASKLTDKANKAAEYHTFKKLVVVYERTMPFTHATKWSSDWEWPIDFVSKLKSNGYPTYTISHNDPDYRGFGIHDYTEQLLDSTPAILMSESVWNGFKAAKPDDPSVVNGWFKKVAVDIPGFAGGVFGGDVIFTQFRE